MTKNDPSQFSDYALAEVDVDPKLVPRAVVPEWVGTTAELLYDWAAEIPWANGQAGSGGQAGTPRAGGLRGEFLGDVLAEHLLPPAGPSLSGSPLTVRSLLEQVRAARLAVGVADELAAAVRAGDDKRTARCLAAFEQASSTYHATLGEDPGDDDGGPAS